MMKTFGFLFFILAVAHAQKVEQGACPWIDPMPNFDLNRYAGKWYEWGKYVNVFQFMGHCDTVEYYPNPDGTFSIKKIQLFIMNGTQNEYHGTLRYDVNPNGNGQLLQNYDNLNLPFGIPFWSYYSVIETDYSSYSVVYTCVDLASFAHISAVWVYTRTRFVMPNTIGTINAVLDSRGIDHALPSFLPTDQVLCPMWW